MSLSTTIYLLGFKDVSMKTLVLQAQRFLLSLNLWPDHVAELSEHGMGSVSFKI